ncbi:MAG: prepilin-type N-terminal cleavage/methylation domain-containing protein, partial [Patescibacteria group bacterium]
MAPHSGTLLAMLRAWLQGRLRPTEKQRGNIRHRALRRGLAPRSGIVSRKGFTLLEVLLVIAIIVALAGMIFGAIRVQRIFTDSLDAEHRHYQKQLENAMYQHLVGEWELLNDVNIPEGQANAKPICTYTVMTDPTCANLDGLIPTYMAALPRDKRETNPNYTGYTVYKNSGRVLVVAAHLGEELGQQSNGPSGFPTIRISIASDGTEGDGSSFYSLLSADGRYVVFQSYASNLVAGDTNGQSDIFLRDRQTNATMRVSVASDGTEGNAESNTPDVSADGRFIIFVSSAANLVAGDTNNRRDVFLRDRQTNATMRVSVASDGTEGNNISAAASVSDNGRYVAFSSFSSNLVSGDTNGQEDVFLRDRETQTTVRVSVANDGTEGNAGSEMARVSANGQYVAFRSNAGNLVPGDTNGEEDIFLRDWEAGTTVRVSVASDGTQGNNSSMDTSMSSDGRFIAFSSSATNLVSGDA